MARRDFVVRRSLSDEHVPRDNVEKTIVKEILACFDAIRYASSRCRWVSRKCFIYALRGLGSVPIHPALFYRVLKN